MKNTKEKDQPACTCIFCTARHYTPQMLNLAISTAKNGNDLCHNRLCHTVYWPIARICVSRKWPNLPLHILQDAICTAAERVFLFFRKHQEDIKPNDVKLLFCVAQRAAMDIYKSYRTYESHIVRDPVNTDDNSNYQLVNFDLQRSPEEGLISVMLMRDRLIEMLQNASRPQAKAIIGAVLLHSGFFDKQINLPIVSKSAILTFLADTLSDVINEDVKAILLAKCTEVLDEKYNDLKYIKASAYNRKKLISTRNI